MQRLKTFIAATGFAVAALSAEAAPATLAAAGQAAPVPAVKTGGVDLSILFGFPHVYAPRHHYHRHQGHVLAPYHAGRIAAHHYGINVYSVSRNYGYYDVWGYSRDGIRVLVQINAFSGGIHGVKYFGHRPHYRGHGWKYGHDRHHDWRDRGHHRDHDRHDRGHDRDDD